MPKPVHVETSNTIFEQEGGAYEALADHLSKYEGWLLVLDDHTNKHCLPHFTEKFGAKARYSHILHSGDKNKTLDRCSSIWTKLTEIKAGRNFAIVNLGGGMVSDVGGFSAACYKRGIDYVNIPTSLLAMVDAAHGGKTGINYKGLKNQVGSFHMSSLVLIDTDYLDLLPNNELKSGYAEVLKHAIIANAELWGKLKDFVEIQDLVSNISLLKRSIQIKNDIVQRDFHDTGERKKLNFGHTIGHALESWSHEVQPVGLSHGEAVANGMIIEAAISMDLGLIDEQAFKEIATTIGRIYPKQKLREDDISELISFMRHDKKNKDGEINFTLIKGIGEAIIDQYLDQKAIYPAFKKYMSLR